MDTANQRDEGGGARGLYDLRWAGQAEVEGEGRCEKVLVVCNFLSCEGRRGKARTYARRMRGGV